MLLSAKGFSHNVRPIEVSTYFNNLEEALLNWSLKWCYFRAICFVQTLEVSLCARTMQASLSSKTWVPARVVVFATLKMLSEDSLMMLCWWISCSKQHNRSNSWVAMLRTMYSLSVVLNSISLYNLLTQWIRHPQNVMIYPVRERMLTHKAECCWCQMPAKSASTYKSRLKVLDWNEAFILGKYMVM